MDGFKKLDLSTETLRALTRDELDLVAGGVASTGTCPDVTTLLTMTQTPMCPSGSTWFTDCESRGACA